LTKQIAILAVLLVSSARADEYHFTVPIKAQHLMPSVKMVIICSVYKQKPAGFMLNGPDLIGRQEKSVYMPASGAVDTTEHLDFYNAKGTNGMAKYYQCGLYLETATTRAIPDTNKTELGQVFQAKPGTSLNVKQEGDMPGGYASH